MSRLTNIQPGYLVSEEVHSQIMRGIDSLRFLEGLLSGAAPGATPCFDQDDLAGYLQLLLEHTYTPLKSLKYQRWAPAGDDTRQPSAAAAPADPVDEEAELLGDYRTMLESDRKHLRRCAQALAFASGQRVQP